MCVWCEQVWLGSEQLLHWLAASSSSGQAEDREAWRGQSVIELGKEAEKHLDRAEV